MKMDEQMNKPSKDSIIEELQVRLDNANVQIADLIKIKEEWKGVAERSLAMLKTVHEIDRPQAQSDNITSAMEKTDVKMIFNNSSADVSHGTQGLGN